MYGHGTYGPPGLSLSWDKVAEEFGYTERRHPAFPATNTTLAQARAPQQQRAGNGNTAAAEPEQRKRARDDERAVVGEIRELLAEQNKKQKTIHEDQARLDAQASALHSKREDMLGFMSETMRAQQATILSLNKELTQLGSMHRADLAELEANHSSAIGALRGEIAVLEQRVTESATRINAQEAQLSEAREQRATLERQLAEAIARAPPVIAPIEPAEKARAGRPVAAVVRKREPPVVADASLYSWSAVQEASDQCIALYGFSAQQLTAIHELLPEQDNPRHKRGPKEKHDDRHKLLVLLYYLAHYPTMHTLHELFHMSKTAVNDAVTRMLGAPTETLFEASCDAVDQRAVRYLHGAYFLAVQTPLDTQLADSLWCDEQQGHGQWIHAVHDAASGKALAFYVSETREVDEDWLADFEPNAPDGAVTQRYEARMREKFALAESRYRGALPECESVVRALLAFTNLDLDYNDLAVVEDGIVVDAVDDDEDDDDDSDYVGDDTASF